MSKRGMVSGTGAVTGEELEFHAPIPDDMVAMTEALRADAEQHGLEEEY